MTDLFEGVASIGVKGVSGVDGVGTFKRYCHQELWMKVGNDEDHEW